ncbi:type VII secretion-associated serine protease mycosin [Mycobacterium sp. MYCO198283]|uniref:type VII secretion-associated serine protease mycosin n=1 Tax=Mycobacterium sp. MYCO198283 TaxID=2883505 RepID=UPI001E5924A7|nr:type VII secretion-associated serine protease mycosin [Mycobacterium sp. MYCO198283]MCG5432082.1 type VII secretion-associated serine protease mycosin [Mycobacterium sp. MYCO198283]
MLLTGTPAAGAIPPPRADAAALPADPAPGGAAMEQRTQCTATSLRPGTDVRAVPPSQAMLDLPDAWRFSRGEGQTVAVIDTGVQPGPRLPNVEPGGDYLAATDGLTDCDGHGTLVAGLIAGQPGPDGFSGVAPRARLVSLRQNSANFAPRATGGDLTGVRIATDVATLARAVVHAADLGARIITVAVVTCLAADEQVDQAALGAALRYAAVDKDAVIVAAAGNTGTSIAGTQCSANPLPDAGRPGDPRNWAGVTSVSIPSVWQPYVLSVGAVGSSGAPSRFSMAGPWVGIGSPGENVVSVSNAPGGGLADGVPGNDGTLLPINGTSYAAAYVSGVAALVRSRFPELSAAQVIDRLTRTARQSARTPSNLVGAGTVDPVAALTWELPARAADEAPTRPVAAPPEPAPADATPRTVALAGTGVLAVVAALAALQIRAIRRRKDLSS